MRRQPGPHVLIVVSAHTVYQNTKVVQRPPKYHTFHHRYVSLCTLLKSTNYMLKQDCQDTDGKQSIDGTDSHMRIDRLSRKLSGHKTSAWLQSLILLPEVKAAVTPPTPVLPSPPLSVADFKKLAVGREAARTGAEEEEAAGCFFYHQNRPVSCRSQAVAA